MGKTKITFTLETLTRIVYSLKQEGKRIGFTHGAFDLFHYSHLDLLQKSSEICDFLIVGVESDEKVSAYKSYKRPIVPERQRMQIINSISYVDASFINNTSLDMKSYTELYKELMIDLVTIGYNFQFEDRIEEQTYKSGAKLVKLPTDQDPTTSSLINTILQKYTQEEYQEAPRVG